MKALYVPCFLLVLFSALPSICQQNNACQATLETSGQQLQSDIASIRSAAQSAGQSQAQIQSLIKGYLESAVSSLPATCSQPAAQTAAANNTAQNKPAATSPTQPAGHVSQPAAPTPAPVLTTAPPPPTSPIAPTPVSPQANVSTPPTLTCQNKAMDGSQPVPSLDAVDVSGDPKTVIAITGTVLNGSTGTVQLCTEIDSPTGVPSYTSIASSGKGTIDSKTGAFSITPSTSLTAGQKVVAQWISAADATGASTYGLITSAVIAGQCDADKIDGTIAAPTLTATQIGASANTSISANVSTASTELLRVCIDGLQAGPLVAVKSTTTTTGNSTTISPTLVPIPAPAKSGQTVVTQVVTGTQIGPGSHFGLFSTELVADSCTAVGSGDEANRPTLKDPSVGSQTVSGSIPFVNGSPAANFVRVCLPAPRIAGKDVYENEVAVAPVDHNGNFRVALPEQILSGQRVFVQGITAGRDGGSSTYGLPRNSKPAGLPYSGLFGTFIGGAEQSGYSSDNINTNAFISAHIRSAYWGREHEHGALALSGTVRLLSAPQQSAPNIVATLSNTSNTISQTSLTSVGAVIDYSIGPEIRIWQWSAPGGQVSRLSFIGGIGETTPLTTPSPAILNVPAYNTADCTNLINRYSGSKTPLTSGADLPTPACLENPIPTSAPTAYKYIAYTQQKRTNFLFKWGGGVRFSHIYPAKAAGGNSYSGMLDLTLGQDQTITGGALSGVVFRMDTQYPLPFSSLSSIYFFGSTSVRIASNQNDPTITLTPATGAPTIPDPSILVLSTEQPNRDFYRFGIGLNLSDVFNSVFNKGTPSTQ